MWCRHSLELSKNWATDYNALFRLNPPPGVMFQHRAALKRHKESDIAIVSTKTSGKCTPGKDYVTSNENIR